MQRSDSIGAARLHVELLGGFAASVDGQPCVLPTRKSQALLAYLAVPAGRFHARDKLTALLWGETPEAQARQSLRQALASLRRAIGMPVLLTRGDAVALDATAASVDVGVLEAGLADGDAAMLEQTVALFKGDFLDGLRVDDPAFDEWRTVERERLRALLLEALSRLLRRQLAAEAYEAATRTALRALALDPLQERVHRTLMRLLLRQGRRAAALKQYQACVQCLERELGVAPEEKTRQLFREILQTASGGRQPGSANAPPAAASRDAEEAPMVGRQLEATRLRDALSKMLDGGGGVVLVRGEAGIGKSRLLREFAQEAMASGLRVLRGRCHETEQILPLNAWIDALRGDQATLDPSVRTRLGAAATAQLVRVFPELRQPADEAISAPEQYALLFDALIQLISELSTDKPMVIILEDLHWVDGLSARFLAFLGRRIDRLPVLIVGSMRPEQLEDAPVLAQSLGELRREQQLDEITLDALSEANSLALAKALLPASLEAARRDRIGRDIWVASEGNPFVIVESVRTLRDAPPATLGREAPLARTVQDFVASRLERLAEPARRMVSVAAAIGRNFSFALLARAGGVGEMDAANAVEQLVRRHILAADGDRLDFCHDWIRRVTYEQLLPQPRRLLHAAVGAALEELNRDNLDEIADQLGHHYLRAEDGPKAIAWLSRFAELAGGRYAIDDALRALQQASRLVSELPAGQRDRQTLDLALRQAFILSMLGRQGEIWELLNAHVGHVEQVADPVLTSEYHFRLGLTCFYLGKRAQGQLAAEKALAEAERSENPESIGKALHALSLCAFDSGRPRDGIAQAKRGILLLLQQPRARVWLGLLYHDLALNCIVAGELDAALDAAREADTLSRAGVPRLQLMAAYAASWALTLRGEHELAIETARRCLDLARDAMATGLVKGSLGLAYLEGGDVTSALTTLTEAVGLLGKNPVRSGEGRYLPFLSEAQVIAGDVDAARKGAIRALELCEMDQSAFNAGLARRALGRIALAEHRLGEAEAQLAQSLAAFTQCQAVFEAARTRLDLAAACARRDRAAAREHLASAIDAFAAANAPKRVAQARAVARSLDLAFTVADVSGDPLAASAPDSFSTSEHR